MRRFPYSGVESAQRPFYAWRTIPSFRLLQTHLIPNTHFFLLDFRVYVSAILSVRSAVSDWLALMDLLFFFQWSWPRRSKPPRPTTARPCCHVLVLFHDDRQFEPSSQALSPNLDAPRQHDDWLRRGNLAFPPQPLTRSRTDNRIPLFAFVRFRSGGKQCFPRSELHAR